MFLSEISFAGLFVVWKQIWSPSPFEDIIGLFPNEDILTKEIESWKGFADSLPAEDRKTFMKVINDCCEYSKAIKVKGGPFPTKSLIIAA
jgi:hypothetical protein